jgi:mono/diheme cytochrome c family protein
MIRTLSNIIVALTLAVSLVAAYADEVDFEGEVRPLLMARCSECHGPEEQEGGLRLDARDFAMKGGDSGEVIARGKSEASELLRRVVSNDTDERMPPEGPPLAKDEIELLTRWISGGAVWPETEYDRQAKIDPRLGHWAFQPFDRDEGGGQKDERTIDGFIQAGLKEHELTFSPEADRRTLIRRLSFDMLGLPPTIEEVRSFEAASDPQAWNNLVEKTLKSPRYGERWAQHWLDVIRYADTHGFEVNTPRDNAWPYRDYVIRAFNEDKPYDQFVLEQLAGDALHADEATGFLVAAAVLLPGQIGKDEESKRLARQDELDEIIQGTGATLLGLTIGCARCHDHKFDPITQRDYYAMQAFFAGVEYGDRVIEDPGQAARLAEAASLASRIGKIERDLQLRPPIDPQRNDEYISPITAKFVRFTTLETIDDNKHEPCIDELEIYSVGDPSHNIAHTDTGAKATSSGNYSETGKHQLRHVNDGQYGNDRSWISNEHGGGWVQIELAEPTKIDQVVWGRDRDGHFKDRLPVRYRIEVAREGETWQLVASHADRIPIGTPPDQIDALLRDRPTNSSIDVPGLVAELELLKAKKNELEATRMVYGGTFRDPETTFVLRRGDPEQRVDEIGPAVPGLFTRAVEGESSNAAEAAKTSDGSRSASELLASSATANSEEQQRRLALAKWIASPDNPLTARVMVNRIWMYHFGQGLVATPSDFGLNGTRPSHLELLDWLASEFIRSGWSIKHIHRLILTSRTYRQSHHIDPGSAKIDRDNNWLWRFASRRLEGEAVRDGMLAVSGELNLKMGGPGFDFFKSRGGLSGFPPVDEFGPEQLRRMIYAHKIRMEPVPVFGAFDCPDAGQATPIRSQSTTAIQALNLFNSPFVADRAEKFSSRVNAIAGSDPDRQVSIAFELAVGRTPTAIERQASVAVVNQHGLATLCRVLFNSNEFLFMP